MNSRSIITFSPSLLRAVLFSVHLPYQSFLVSFYFSRHHTLHSSSNLPVVVSKCRIQVRSSLSSFGTYRVIAKYPPRIALAAAAPVSNKHSQLFIDCFEASCPIFELPSLSYREPARLSRELLGFSRFVLGIICASERGVLSKRHSLHHSAFVTSTEPNLFLPSYAAFNLESR